MIKPTCKTAPCPHYNGGSGCEACAGCPGAFPRDARPRSCHSCPWQGRGLPVCITCPGPADDSNAGISYVHIDAAEAGMEMIERQRIGGDGMADEAERGAATVTATLSPEVENALRVVLGDLSQLERTDRDVFFGIWNGRTLTEIADEAGISKQAVSVRVNRMCRRHPKLGAFVAAMVVTSRKGMGGGANRGQRKGGYRQLEMDF